MSEEIKEYTKMLKSTLDGLEVNSTHPYAEKLYTILKLMPACRNELDAVCNKIIADLELIKVIKQEFK